MSEIQGKPVYGICACKEKVQVLSVDQVTDLIQQMAANDWQVPADYIPKTSVNGIVEQNSKDEVKLWVGTQAEYDLLPVEEQSRIFAIISDDNSLQTIENTLEQHNQSIENVNKNITDIYERLANLGFKEGSITLDSALTSNGTVLKNTIKRQGNYVLMDFEWDYWGSASMQSIEPIHIIGKVPSEFMVNSETTCGYAITNVYLTTTLSNDIIIDNVKILADGSVQIYSGSFIGNITHIKFGIGYEAAPIN